MTTPLVKFTSNGNSITYELPDHTVAEPRLVIQKRTVATSVDGKAVDSFKTVYGTTDADGELLSSKISIETIVSRPVRALTADVEAALAVHRDITASDEVDAMVESQRALA
jgi:hypothetical protein